jgi:peptidoglycan-N-acetylglucosamine deacetylase
MKFFTVDLEDWFHLLDFEPTKNPKNWEKFESRVDYGLDKILAVLNDSKIKATFFVLAWLAERRPELVKELKAKGHEIASHGYGHQLAFEQTSNDFYEDILKSKFILEDIISDKVIAYRAPGFSIKKDNIDYLRIIYKAGYRIDSSLFPSRGSHGGLENSLSKPYTIEINQTKHLLELPISSYTFLNKNIIISGGGYFRIAPLWLLRKNFVRNEYLMTYFHPRDFDDQQPLLEGLSPFRRFKAYIGLKKSYFKLSNLDYTGNWTQTVSDISFENKHIVKLHNIIN